MDQQAYGREVLRLFSWNVNGLRAILKKGFADFVAKERPDILCLQEVRATAEQVRLDMPQYHQFWNPAQRKGYSGTMVLSRIPPMTVTKGIGIDRHDTEGRVLTLEFAEYYLVTVYTPNSQRGLERLAYRTGEWDRAFLDYLCALDRRKPVVTCGDFNAAHQEIDLARPKQNSNNAGFTIQERQGIDRLIAAGFLDTFRQFNSQGGNYTWWAYFARSRERNIGWRIDYFFISNRLRPKLRSAWIAAGVMGSDHCPVAIELARS